MATNFIQPGATVTWANATRSDVASGDVVILSANLAGIAETDIADGTSGEVNIEGVYGLASDDSCAVYDKAYWDGTQVTSTAYGNSYLGVVVLVSTGYAQVKLNVNVSD